MKLFITILLILEVACAAPGNTPAQDLPETPAAPAEDIAALPLQEGTPELDFCDAEDIKVEWIVPQESLRVANPTDCPYDYYYVRLWSPDEPPDATGKKIEYHHEIHLAPKHQAIFQVRDFISRNNVCLEGDATGCAKSELQAPNPQLAYEFYVAE